MERLTAAQKVLLTPDVLYGISSYFDRQDDLLKCVFVHPIWAIVFIRQLWKAPIWKTKESVNLFLRTLRKVKSCFLYGHMVHRVVFKIYRPYDTTSAFTANDLRVISRKCPNLRHLTFATTAPPFSNTNVELLLNSSPNLITFTVLDCDSQWLEGALTPLRQGRCPKLQHLEINDCNRSWSFNVIRDIGENCPSIISLKLYQRVNNLQLANMIVNSFPNLQTFECKYINEAGLQGLITGLHNLKSLSAQFENDIQVSENLAPKFAKLEALRIRAIHVQDHNPLFSVAFSQHQPCLRQLYLATLHITDKTIKMIAMNCHHLESIELFMCFYLTDSAISTIAQYRGKKLKHLMLAYNAYITDTGINQIATHCTELRSVVIISCAKLTNIAFNNIARECKSLVEVTVRHDSCQMLASIVHTLATRNRGTLKVLKAYDVSTKEMDKRSKYKADVSVLERLAIRCPQIRTLVLKCCIQEKNPSAIHKFKNLEELQISTSVKFSSSHIRQLEKHRRLKYVTIIYGPLLNARSRIQESRLESTVGMNITLLTP
ncbi:3235_t:CDS:2, partial [Gigaspora rosea]